MEKISHPYPAGFVFGRGVADPGAFSLSGLKIRRCLAGLAGLRQGRVLELGCGGGQYLRAIRRARPELVLAAVDLDPGAIAAVADIQDAACMVADAGLLPFSDRVFDAVIGFDILEHIPEPAQVLAEAGRVLVHGGLLHLYVPCEGNPGCVYQQRGHSLKARWGGHVQQFTTPALAALVQHAGFEIIRLRPSDYWITQQLDYLFFSKLDQSPHPEKLWAAQALAPDRSLSSRLLRLARRILSMVSWLEAVLRHGERGSMGVHITAKKKAGPGPNQDDEARV
jgi:SAM-dependent methyltransferase